MKKKILYGILSIFMSVAIFVGVTFFVGDSLVLNDNETTEVATTPTSTGNWLSNRNSAGILYDGNNIYISSAANLAYFAYYANGGRSINGYSARSMNVYLSADIDLSAYYWTPIGTFSNPFAGNFYGQGYTISGLFLNGAYSKNLYSGYVTDSNSWSSGGNWASGLFGVTSDTDDVDIENFSLSGGHSKMLTMAKDEDTNNFYIGSVVGKAGTRTTISNLVVSHSISVEADGDDSSRWNLFLGTLYDRQNADVFVGGIAGRAEYIENCIVNSSANGIYFKFIDKLGSYNGMNTSGHGNYHIGGIVGVAGYDAYGYVKGCYSYEAIKTDSNDDARAYVGRFYTGGIAGYSRVNITGCNNHGLIFIYETIHNFDDFDKAKIYFLGGIVGYSDDNGYLSGCMNYGNITCKTLATVGGIGGHAEYINACANFAKLNVTGTEGTADIDTIHLTGGIVGHLVNGYVYDSVNYGDVLGIQSAKFSWDNGWNTNLRAYGGIVGRSDESSIMYCVNYGDLYAGWAWSGGIVGIADGDDGQSYVANCVNIGKVQDVKCGARYVSSAITEKLAWNALFNDEFNQTVTNCYYLQSVQSSTGVGKSKDLLTSYSFYADSANWSGGAWTLENNSVNDSYQNVSKYSYFDGFWFSEVPVAYLKTNFDSHVGNTAQTLDFCLVPNAAIATIDVHVDNTYYLGDFLETQLPKTVVYNRESSAVELKEVFTNYVPYLRGVSYTLFGYSNFEIDLSGGAFWFDVEKATVTPEDASNTFESYSTSTIKKNGTGSSFKIGFRLCPAYISAYYSSYFNSYYATVSATAKNCELEVKYINDAKIVVDEPIGGKVVVDPTEAVKYGDKFTFKATPYLGYYFQSLDCNSINESAKNKTIYSSSDLGEISADSDTRYMKNGTLGAKFALVNYSGKILYKDNGADYGGSTYTNEFSSQTLEKTLQIVMEENTNEFTSKGYFSYGYEYIFSVCEETDNGENLSDPLSSSIILYKDYVDKLKEESNDSNGYNYNLNFNFLEFINLFGNINSNKFNIVVNRIPIGHTLVLHKMADSYNPYWKFNEYVDSYGGTASLSKSNGVLMTDSVELSSVAADGFEYLGVSFSANTSQGQPGSKFDWNNAISAAMISAYKEKHLAADDKTLDLYVFFGLQTYNTTGAVEGLTDELANNSNYNYVSFTSQQYSSGSGAVEQYLNDLEEFNTYYYAPITLQAKDFEDDDALAGYKFAGFYLVKDNETYLLSTEKKYIYSIEPSSGVEKLKIVAKYVKFDTGTKPNSSSQTYKDLSGNTISRTVYTITEAQELAWISNQVATGANDFENEVIRLANDIDMSVVAMLPIGIEGKPFKGTFEGNGFVIENFDSRFAQGNSTDYAGSVTFKNTGLFGVTNGATIKDFTLVGGNVYGYANVGAVVGKATNTTIENVNNFSCNVEVKDVIFYDVLGKKLAEEKFATSFSNASYDEENKTHTYSSLQVDGVFDVQQNVAGVVGVAEDCKFNKVSNYADIAYENGILNTAGLTSNGDSNKFNLCFNEGSFNKNSSSGEVESGSGLEMFNYFANGTIDATNCYYKTFDSNGDELSIYVYNATLEEGTVVHTGNVTTQKLDTDIWLLLYGKYVLRDFYWA